MIKKRSEIPAVTTLKVPVIPAKQNENDKLFPEFLPRCFCIHKRYKKNGRAVVLPCRHGYGDFYREYREIGWRSAVFPLYFAVHDVV